MEYTHKGWSISSRTDFQGQNYMLIPVQKNPAWKYWSLLPNRRLKSERVANYVSWMISIITHFTFHQIQSWNFFINPHIQHYQIQILHSNLGGVSLLLGQHPACCPSYIPAASFQSFIACYEVNIDIHAVRSSLQEIVQASQFDGSMNIPVWNVKCCNTAFSWYLQQGFTF